MLSDGEDDASLKRWIVKRLEDISDADSDVLADYVLALLRHESPEEQVRKLCIEQLEDFLKDHTATFVDDVFQTIRTKSYLPAPAASKAHSPPPVAADPSPSFPAASLEATAGAGQARVGQRRKRSFSEQDTPSRGPERNSHGHNPGGERAYKQLRRGSVRGSKFDSPNTRQTRPPLGPAPTHGITGQVPVPRQDALPPSVPDAAQAPVFPDLNPLASAFPFAPNDPMAALMAMQAVGFPPLPVLPPGLPPLPSPFAPAAFVPEANASIVPGTNGQPVKRMGERCKDYDDKGFCALGGNCPYDHGADHIVVPGQGEEYDPHNSAIMTDVQRSNTYGTNGHATPNDNNAASRGRGRGRGRGVVVAGSTPGRKGRADFSHAGPNHDQSITTVVVENIPEDHFNEPAVRSFFAAFGNIEEVQMQPYKRLAIVKYDSWASAKKAYDSPKVIFDNRFVKVYWYKPDSGSSPAQSANGKATATSPNPAASANNEQLAEIRRKQEELQKVHEEKMKKIKEAEDSRRELEKRKGELLKSQAEEKKKLMARLAAKAAKTPSERGTADPASAFSPPATPTSAKEDAGKLQPKSPTDALKAQLAILEAEARSLGLHSALSDDSSSVRGRGRGRGLFRGRGSFVPRGRGYDPLWGGYRGRGAAPYAWAGRGSTNKLDNRPRRVAVSGVEFDVGKNEALRQFLLGVGEYVNIEPNPGRGDSQIVTFKDRFTAEKFIASASEIPGVGRAELTWVANATSNNHTATADAISRFTDAPLSADGASSPGRHAPSPAALSAADTPKNGHHEDGDGGHGGAASKATTDRAGSTASKDGGDAADAIRDSAQDSGLNLNEDYDVADDNDRWMAA